VRIIHLMPAMVKQGRSKSDKKRTSRAELLALSTEPVEVTARLVG
jgi:hypothetical protein